MLISKGLPEPLATAGSLAWCSFLLGLGQCSKLSGAGLRFVKVEIDFRLVGAGTR